MLIVIDDWADEMAECIKRMFVSELLADTHDNFLAQHFMHGRMSTARMWTNGDKFKDLANHLIFDASHCSHVFNDHFLLCFLS